MTRRQSIRAAVLLGVGVVAVLLGVGLGRSKPRLAATDSRVIASGHGIVIAAGAERCQGEEYIPTDARRLRLFTAPLSGVAGQPLIVTFTGPDGRLAERIQLAGGYPKGAVFLALRPVSRDVFPARLCIRDAGTIAMAFAGNQTSDQPQALPAHNIPGERQTDEVRADLFRSGSASWFEMGPQIAHRFPVFHPSWVGPWTMWVALALALLSALSAVGLVRRQAVR